MLSALRARKATAIAIAIVGRAIIIRGAIYKRRHESMYKTIQKLSKEVKSSVLLESWKSDNFMVSNRKSLILFSQLTD